MDIGTAIFLSSLMFAAVALYAITKDRWRWQVFAKVVAAIVIGTIAIFILIPVAQQLERGFKQWSDKGLTDEELAGSAPADRAR
jgi:hypothetical protein